jgi:hypothetical protein
MASKLDQFLANAWETGIARANRFEVFITPPSSKGFSSLNSNELLRHLSLTCEAVEIPGQSITTAELKINGLTVIPVPYSFSYTNQINLTFKLSEDYRERNAMLAWQDLVFGNGRGFGYYNEYVGTITVRPLNTANEAIQEFIFRNCYPITIQDLGYNWASSNEALKQTVTFSFYTMETQTGSIRSSGTKPLYSGIPTGLPDGLRLG